MRMNTYDESKVAATAGASAVEIGFDMTPGRQYELRAKGADLWYRVVATTTNPAVVGADNNHFLPNGQISQVAAIGAARTRISFIRDAATDVTAILSATPQTAGV